jgi:hypothetical protein
MIPDNRGYDINTVLISSLYVTFCGQTKHVLGVRVCSTFTSHLWARGNPHAIHECEYEVRFSFSIWAGIIGDIVVVPYLLPDCSTM